MWLNFFDEIYVLNLLKRTDRLLQITYDFERYEIPFTRISAVEDNENGARGLRDTMVSLFHQVLEKNQKNIIIFEDDAKPLVEPFWFHDTMNKIVAQLPENYHICHLGGQASSAFSHFHSANLLPVNEYYATHSVIYSQQGIKEILARDMGYPIDNWYVKNIQVLGHCFTCDPILFSQHPGISDIGGQFIDWYAFIVPRHAQKIAEMTKKW